jgi:type I restriction enzyme S subunit
VSELPKGWAKVALGDIIDIQKGKKPYDLGSLTESRNIPYINIAAFETGIIREYAPCQNTPSCNPEDTLLVWDGARAGLSGRGIKGFIGSTLAKISSPYTESDYLFYFFQSIYGYLNTQTKGVGIPHIDPNILKNIDFPLSPLNEQVRIVTKLEELLSDLDAGVSELKTAQAKLIQYRQSLLKAAVEGELTREWRESQLANTAHETGAQLLARILQERRKRWEDKQLAKFAEQGKQPPKDWQKKYPEPVQPDTTDLPALPEGWVWATVDQISEIQGGIQKKPSRAPVKNKYPFLRVANVYRAQLRLDDIHEIELLDGELERLALIRGDILIVEGNGSLSEIGRCAVWDGSIENAVHQNHLIRSRPVLMRSDFVETWLNSFRGIEYMTKLAATTSGLYTLSVGKISKIPLPIPSLVEQTKILELLQEALDQEKNQSTAIEQSLKQSAAQRKNILRAAFAGELVPQDPNDEPASVLLERIQAERAAQTAAKKPRGQKNTPNKNGVCHEN